VSLISTTHVTYLAISVRQSIKSVATFPLLLLLIVVKVLAAVLTLLKVIYQIL
jgi:hypothetical protein